MSEITAPTLNLDQVKVAFENWRRIRIGREHIPEHLWGAALALIPHHSINTVQQQLRLNLYQLKQRLAATTLAQSSLPKPEFLEIKPAQLMAISEQTLCATNKPPLDASRVVGESICRIAFERSDGCRITIELPSDATIIPVLCTNLLRA